MNCAQEDILETISLRRGLSVELERATYYRDEWQKVAQENNRLRKACDEFVAAWAAYRVFPSFANEKLFESAIKRRNEHLPSGILRNTNIP